MKKVEIYSFEVCPYCVQAKAMMDALNVSYTEYVITREEMEPLSQRSGMKTAPQIFIDGEILGGFDALSALVKSGKLDETLGR